MAAAKKRCAGEELVREILEAANPNQEYYLEDANVLVHAAHRQYFHLPPGRNNLKTISNLSNQHSSDSGILIHSSYYHIKHLNQKILTFKFPYLCLLPAFTKHAGSVLYVDRRKRSVFGSQSFTLIL